MILRESTVEEEVEEEWKKVPRWSSLNGVGIIVQLRSIRGGGGVGRRFVSRGSFTRNVGFITTTAVYFFSSSLLLLLNVVAGRGN